MTTPDTPDPTPVTEPTTTAAPEPGAAAEAASASAPTGLGGFQVIWLGQVASLLGSGLTSFAVGVWVFEKTGSVTLFTWIAVAASAPQVLLAPLAGVLVDRHDRRWMMILSDAGAAAATAALMILALAGRLELWHIYLLVASGAAFGTLQFPAFSAATTLLVPKARLAQAAGMVQLGEATARIAAPALAGALLVAIGLGGVAAVDLITFFLAVATLLAVRVPRPPVSPEAAAARERWWREAAFGWRYIRQRPGLLALLGYFAATNLLIPMAIVLAPPMVLSFSTPERLGVVVSLGVAGSLVGGLAMAGWGGPRRRVRGILAYGPLLALGFLLVGLRPSLPLITVGLFVAFFTLPVVNALSQAIWQSKVEPSVQGRVFAIRGMVAQVTAPLGYLLAGPLAERAFIPLLVDGGPLASSVGRVLGTGPGRGIGLLYVVLGLLFLGVVALASAYPRLRHLEDEVPDALGDE